MDIQKLSVEKNRAWYLGNTTVREAQRLRAGLKALAGSPLEGNLDGRERERAFAILLSDADLRQHGKLPSKSV
jgi:hypothetical protein